MCFCVPAVGNSALENRRDRLSLYAQTWAAVRTEPRLILSLVVGSLMHAAGHAFLAAAAGVLARALAGRGPMDLGSTPVVALAICGVFAALAKLVGGSLASWGEARVASTVGARVRLAALDAVLDASASDTRHSDHGSSSGERVAALTTHVHEIEHGVSHGVLAEIRAIVALLPLMVLLVVLAPRLAGSAVVALAGFALFAFAVRRAFRRAHTKAKLASGELIEAADDAVRHAELWATYGARRRIRSHVASIGEAIARESARLKVRAALISSTSEVLGALSLVLVLVLATNGLLGVDHGMVVPFSIAFFMAYKPLRDLVDGRLARAKGEDALRAAMIEVVPEAPRRPTNAANAATWKLESLTLEAARTGFGTNTPVSITIAPGSIVAIVGATGTGKSSLLRALLGLAKLESGHLRYGGSVLDDAGVGPDQRPFAWVPQDAPIVGDTLAINVALGRADDDDEVLDPRPYLRALGAESLADKLGGDEILRSSTRPISGGERQWIAVARALATGLPVLLLDEPTSALDSESQERLLRALKNLRGERTVILVTHRREPLRIADQIVRMDQASASPGGVTISSAGPDVTVTSSAS